MGRFRKQPNATSHPHNDSAKTAIEEKWNKMSEEFILKVRKSFWRRVDTIIEKKWRPYGVNLPFLILLFIFLNKIVL